MRVGVAVLMLASLLFAVDSLEKVTVNPLISPTKQTGESVYTGAEIDSFYGEKSSVYDALDLMSGVVVNRHGASEEGSVKIRGVDSSLGALSVEGVPNSGLGPIGARDYIYDLENIKSISLYKASAPVDIGLGVGSRGGAIDLHPKWASKKFGVVAKQSAGSNASHKTFLRVDSGSLGSSQTALSGSFSYSDGDKFKGDGKIGERLNANFTLHKSFSSSDLKIWYNQNDQKKHHYRALDLMSAKSSPKTDFVNDPTNKEHYDYNRAHFKNRDLIVISKTDLSESTALTFKPYLSNEDSSSFATGGPAVQERIRSLKRAGLLAEISHKINDTNISFGYHYEHNDATVETKNLRLVSSNLEFVNKMLATDGVTHTHSPYAKFGYLYNGFSVQLGAKYFVFKDSDLENPDSDLNRKGKDYTIFLPTAGASYSFDESNEIYLNYGKSFVRPYSYAPLVNTFKQNKTAFQNAGISAKDLFDGYKIEESNSVDLGYRFISDSFQFLPTVFWAKHSNLLTPIKNAGVTYLQNVGDATSYGVEADIGLFLADNLMVFLSPSYMVFEYDNNILGSDTKGKQVIDTPKTTLKTGVVYAKNRFRFVPTARYIGTRYADSSNGQKVDSFVVYDALLEYKAKVSSADLMVGLEVKNIFDKSYISDINPSDDTVSSGAARYFVGAPRTVMFYAGVQF